MIRQWFKSGTPWIWLNAGAISIALVAVFGLLLLILFRGMSHFWPANVEAFHYQNNDNAVTIIAEIIESESVPLKALHNVENSQNPEAGDEHGNVSRYLVKTGNRDILGSDFQMVVRYRPGKKRTTRKPDGTGTHRVGKFLRLPEGCL